MVNWLSDAVPLIFNELRDPLPRWVPVVKVGILIPNELCTVLGCLHLVFKVGKTLVHIPDA